MKIGLFGGSFNPIHTGHIALARQLREQEQLDEVWLMVSPQNPLKQGSSDLLDDQLRYAMVEQALRSEEGLVASDYELRLPKPSYTWNTLQHLQHDFPHHTFTLLIGADNWQLFSQWYRAADILRHHRIVVYPRRGCTIDAAKLPPQVTVAPASLLNISSTEVRQRVRQGESIEGMVPACIENSVRKYYTK